MGPTEPPSNRGDSVDAMIYGVSTFHKMPQDFYDNLGHWLTGVDARTLSFTPDSLYIQLARRKWTSLNLGQDLFTSDEWLNAVQRNHPPKSQLRVSPQVPRHLTHIPVAHYIRSLTFNDRGLRDLLKEPNPEPEAEYVKRITRSLDMVSAAKNLKYLEFPITILLRWARPIHYLNPASRLYSPVKFEEISRPQTTWETIRLVALQWDTKIYDPFKIEVAHKILTSYMPNLIGLNLHFQPFNPFLGYSIVDLPFYKEVANCYGTSLRRLSLNIRTSPHSVSWKLTETHNQGLTNSLPFNASVLESITRDFPGLEWLALYGMPLFGESRDWDCFPESFVLADRLTICIDSLKRLKGLKRLALEFFRDPSAAGRAVFDEAEFLLMSEDTFKFLALETAMEFLEHLPALEHVYFCFSNANFIKFDRSQYFNRTSGVGIPADSVDWRHADALPDGVWPLGIKRSSEAGAYV